MKHKQRASPLNPGKFDYIYAYMYADFTYIYVHIHIYICIIYTCVYIYIYLHVDACHYFLTLESHTGGKRPNVVLDLKGALLLMIEKILHAYLYIPKPLQGYAGVASSAVSRSKRILAGLSSSAPQHQSSDISAEKKRRRLVVVVDLTTMMTCALGGTVGASITSNSIAPCS